VAARVDLEQMEAVEQQEFEVDERDGQGSE
jgi:hypothetical protein